MRRAPPCRLLELEQRQLAAEIPGVADGDEDTELAAPGLKAAAASLITTPLLAQLGCAMLPKPVVALHDDDSLGGAVGEQGDLGAEGFLEGFLRSRS